MTKRIQNVLNLIQQMNVEEKQELIRKLFEDEPTDTILLSEPALAKDWNRPEEDEAWQHLQQEL